MAYASRAGRSRVSARNPQAQAVCDRCGIWHTHAMLNWQFDWAGSSLINKRLLVCCGCMDVPQQQLRAIVIPADPVPIQNPRVEYLVNAETNYRTTTGQDTIDFLTGLPIPGTIQRITQAGDNRVPQQTGAAPGSVNQQPGTDPDAPGNSNPGLPYQNTNVPKTGPLK